MAKDPYKYFRVEARELIDGLTQGILELEKSDARPDVVPRLLRLAHTLKGAARVVRQPGIAEHAHTIEGILTAHRETGQPLPKEQGSALLRLVDDIASRVKTLEHPIASEASKPVAPAASPVAEEPLETLRVEIQEMDALLRSVNEANVQLGALRKEIGSAVRLREVTSLFMDLLAERPGELARGSTVDLRRVRTLGEELRMGLARFQRELQSNVERMNGDLAEIREVSHRLRLIPANTIFSSLDRAVRDAAQTVGKGVVFETSGGDVRLDANVLASLRDALMHVVRNAVAHGIESEAERIAAGKAGEGRVRLDVERRGTRVTFICRDDGRGVDVEAVRALAVTRGMISAADAKLLSPEKVLLLLRGGGISTSGTVTELSGRGIGLDVVRATAAKLKGEMSIRSEAGLGAVVEMQVPISIASLQGLVVEAEGTVAAIPLDSVQQTLRINDSEIARSADSDSILHEGNVIPFLPLDRALRRSNANARGRRIWSAIVVQDGARRVAVGVDRLLGTSNIVMRSLPSLMESDPVVSGASLDPEGNPQLVLDPSGLVAAADRARGFLSEEPAAPAAPILVIDDSLTTRMLEQSILQSAGYEVELAVSAEEAFVKARAKHYGLFIVDVEMPGMDGFEFVTQTRADPVLRNIPAILVTSLNTEEYRRKGEVAGARAYIVKSEFDQDRLLKTIRTLIG